MDGMIQLQTLDVKHTFIAILPLDICKLPKLQYIHAGNTEPWYEGDGIVTIQSAAAEAENVDGTPTILPPPPSSEAKNVGVEVPTGIANLTVLHTLGVVDVRGAGGKALLVLGELQAGKLPQLHKLKVSGINRGNIRHFISAISGHRHLDSLSVRLDDDAILPVQPDAIIPPVKHVINPPAQPRKTLRKLKLYGNVLNLPVWIKYFQSLKCFDIEMTLPTGENQRALEELVKKRILCRLCVKLIEDGDVHLSMPDHQCSSFQNLKIDCRSKAKVTFGESKLVEVLKVKCSSGSDLEISGLENLKSLKEIWLIGAYGDTLKRLSNHPKMKKLVLKLVQPRPVC